MLSRIDVTSSVIKKKENKYFKTFILYFHCSDCTFKQAYFFDVTQNDILITNDQFKVHFFWTTD